MIKTDLWKNWEGRVAEGKFPLRQWVGGSDHSAVFRTERSGEASQNAAIKLIPAGSNPEQQLARWRAVAQLSHPHLLPILNVGRCEIDGIALLYVVMEFAEEDLSQILPQRALTPAETADMLPPILDAVSYLHGLNYLHGALKPSNLLAAGDRLKLSMDRVTPIGGTASSPVTRSPYDAPETAAGEVTPAADVWSLGMTLVVALTQRLPAYRDGGQTDPVVADAVAEPFRAMARNCLHRDVAERCTIANIRAWRPPHAESTARAVEAAQVTATGEKESSRWHVLLPVLVVLLLVALFLGWKFSRHPESTQPTANVEGSAPSPAPAQSKPSATSSMPASSGPPASTGVSTASGAPRANHHPPSESTSAVPAEKTIPDLTPGGGIVRRVLPEVPRSASHTISGTIKVTVRVDVDPDGKVNSAKITHAGSSTYFNRLAVQAAQRWEFSPPQVSGQRSPSAWNLRFQFKRSGTQAFAARAR